MSTKSPEYKIVCAFGGSVCGSVARKAVRQLQGLKRNSGMLSGDDSLLESVWEEICVQLQGEESFSWGTYEEFIKSIIVNLVNQLKSHERDAAWAITSEGWDWFYEQNDTDERPPVVEDDIVRHISGIVLEKGCNWNNPRIRRFLDSSYLD